MKKNIVFFGLGLGLMAFSGSARAETVVACEKDGYSVQVEGDGEQYALTYDLGYGPEVVEGVDVAVIQGGGAVLGGNEALLVLATTEDAGVSSGEFVAEGESVTGLVCAVTL